MCSLSLDIETFYEQTRSSTASIKAAEQILYCIRKCVYELQDKCKREFNDFDPNLRIRNAKYLCFEHIFQSIRHPYFWWNVFKFGSQHWTQITDPIQIMTLPSLQISITHEKTTSIY
eukprot:321985_1